MYLKKEGFVEGKKRRKTSAIVIFFSAVVLIVAMFLVISRVRENRSDITEHIVSQAQNELANKNYKNVIESLEKADSFSGDNKADAYKYLGQSYLALKKYPEAQRSYEKLSVLLDSGKEKAFYYNLIANCLRQQNKIDEAVSYYEKSITLDASSATTWVNLFNILKNSNQIEKASEVATRAKLANPTNTELANSLTI